MSENLSASHSAVTDENILENLTIDGVMRVIPHRYPMLLLDRLEDIVKGSSAIGIKNVTINEPFFAGHFPGRPVMPGVLIVEAMAQTAAALVMHSLGITHQETYVYFMSISDARFRSPVMPGDTLRLQVEKRHQRGMVWRFYGRAIVSGKVMAEATYTAQISTHQSGK